MQTPQTAQIEALDNGRYAVSAKYGRRRRLIVVDTYPIAKKVAVAVDRRVQIERRYAAPGDPIRTAYIGGVEVPPLVDPNDFAARIAIDVAHEVVADLTTTTEGN